MPQVQVPETTMIWVYVLPRQMRKPRSLWQNVCVCETFLNMGTEGPKHGSFTVVAASHMDHLTCKTQRSASGNYCRPALESNLKALFEIAGAISNFFRGNVFVRNTQRLAKVASPNSTLTVLREQWGLCWDSRENQSCTDALSETAAHPQLLGKKLTRLITDLRTKQLIVEIT